MSEIKLPSQLKTEATKNPRTMILYGLCKVGKTTALSKLPNCLIVDTEKGTDFIEGSYVIGFPEGLGPVSKFKWLRDLAAKIREEGKPYDYVAIDTITELDELAEFVGTFNYMNSAQGKNFNRGPSGEMLKPSDPNYESVLSLPNGYGYRYTRQAIIDIFNDLKDLGKICTIFICHVSDKMISKKGGEEVMTKDLALVGKTRDILPRSVDAIGNVYNEDGLIKVSFNGDEEKIGGVRAKHLIGYNDELNWSKIFIK